jgi:hypothetical protein
MTSLLAQAEACPLAVAGALCFISHRLLVGRTDR